MQLLRVSGAEPTASMQSRGEGRAAAAMHVQRNVLHCLYTPRQSPPPHHQRYGLENTTCARRHPRPAPLSHPARRGVRRTPADGFCWRCTGRGAGVVEVVVRGWCLAGY
ncbi:hypothetical protein E2C01_061655 [Portunus trituberculatus]|uniref:Uncharacterized protein n=1 Tax=Portunus trituberculatus TaxID=210409 RepID=A0A5B7HF04_PORTR|nr:hypothetical protein [Portunus trituberculatus]